MDFEFPISKDYAELMGAPELVGIPYKSSDKPMIYSSELDMDIPEHWSIGGLHDLVELIDGDRGNNYPSQGDFTEAGYCMFLNTGNVTKDGFNFSDCKFITKEKDEILRKGKLERLDTVLTTRGTVGNTAYFSNKIEYENLRINSGMIILRGIGSKQNSLYVYTLLKSSFMKDVIANFLSGSAQPHLPIKDIKTIPIILPDEVTIKSFISLIEPMQCHYDLLKRNSRQLERLIEVLLAGITKMES